MDQRTKLHLALIQVNNLIELLKDNEYQKFLYGYLISIRVELQRQLTNIQHSSKIKE